MKPFTPIRPGRAGILALYFLYAAEVARTLTSPGVTDVAPYAALFALFIVLFTVVLWRPNLPRVVLHLYLVVQCAITLLLLALDPALDLVTTLYAFVAYQVALVFPSPIRWMWVGTVVALTGGSLMIAEGPVQGLAMGLITMAACIALPALVVANEQAEQARAGSQALVAELRAAHARLETYAEQAEELARLAERTRLARELHDSVSQSLFSIRLQSRAAQLTTAQDPIRLRAQLDALQTLAQNALAQMRSLIAVWRPK